MSSQNDTSDLESLPIELLLKIIQDLTTRERYHLSLASPKLANVYFNDKEKRIYYDTIQELVQHDDIPLWWIKILFQYVILKKPFDSSILPNSTKISLEKTLYDYATHIFNNEDFDKTYQITEFLLQNGVDPNANLPMADENIYDLLKENLKESNNNTNRTNTDNINYMLQLVVRCGITNINNIIKMTI